MKIFSCVLLIFFLTASSVFASDQKLSSAYERELIQRVKGVFASTDQKEKAFDSARPVCATPIFLELFANYDRLSYEGKKIISSLSPDRPDSFWTDPETCDTPGGHFKIHYVISGEDAVFEPGVDTLPADGQPDYVNRCAEILDYVWEYQIDTLGYTQPPSDGWHIPNNGGDGKYDVYLTFMEAGYLGVTYPEDWYAYPRAISYVVLRSDYSIYTQPPYNLYQDQYDGMKVTAAHEFFHAIQLGYDATEYGGSSPDYQPYWMEMTATWMEDMLYDEVNDYLGYLYYFFHYPWLSLKTFSSDPADKPKYFHAYASCVWPIYLSEKFGSDIIHDIWTRCAELAGDNALAATGEILTSRGSSFDQAFQEFTIWNYFTSIIADTQTFYSEGSLFPPIFIYPSQTHSSGSYPLTVNTVPKPPENLSSNYVTFKTDTGVLGDFNIGFYGDSLVTWEVSLIGYKPGNPPWFSQINLNSLQNGTEIVHDWNLYDKIIMIPTVTSRQGNSFSYAYTASVDTSVDVDDENVESVASSVQLFQNYPNPFNATTIIPFTVAAAPVNGSQLTENSPIHTTLIIYNILGQEITTLVDQEKLPGSYEVTWDGRDNNGIEVASGIYLYQIKAGQYSEVKKMLLVK
jgi:hypothetical protein